jgi:hypothetical protein
MLKQYTNPLFQRILSSGYEFSLFSPAEGNLSLNELMEIAHFPILRQSYSISCGTFVISIKESRMRFTLVEHPQVFEKFCYGYTCFNKAFSERFFYNPSHKYQDKSTSFLDTGYWHSFFVVEHAYQDWLDTHVKNYIQEAQLPDLWENVQNYIGTIGVSNVADVDSSDFSVEERREIKSALTDFKRVITEKFQVDAQQYYFINQRLDYLTKAVDRLKRFDWQGLAVSTLISIAVNLGVDTEGGRHLYSLFVQAMSGAIKMLP